MSVLAHTRDIIQELMNNTAICRRADAGLADAILEANHIFTAGAGEAALPCGRFPCG